MSPDLIATLALAAIGAVSALATFVVLRGPLRDLLTRTVGIEAATQFYARVLILGLVYVAIGVVFGSGVSMDKERTFMSYVWHVGGHLDDLFGWLVGFLALYMVLITILLAAYRRRDQ
jgi:hypothetical protein